MAKVPVTSMVRFRFSARPRCIKKTPVRPETFRYLLSTPLPLGVVSPLLSLGSWLKRLLTTSRPWFRTTRTLATLDPMVLLIRHRTVGPLMTGSTFPGTVPAVGSIWAFRLVVGTIVPAIPPTAWNLPTTLP